jgi:DNA-binding transcriptional ArsR family regulator
LSSETRQVRVQITLDGMNFECNGDAAEIFQQTIRFLSQVVPTYDLARKLLYVSNLAGLTDRVAEFARVTSDGQLLLANAKLPTAHAINIFLFTAYVTAKIGNRGSDTVEIDQLTTGIGKSQKTVRNTLVDLQKNGLVERAERGNYRITQKGLMELEKLLLNPNGLRTDGQEVQNPPKNT